MCFILLYNDDLFTLYTLYHLQYKFNIYTTMKHKFIQHPCPELAIKTFKFIPFFPRPK